MAVSFEAAFFGGLIRHSRFKTVAMNFSIQPILESDQVNLYSLPTNDRDSINFCRR